MMHTAEGTEVAGFIYFQGKISLLDGIFFSFYLPISFDFSSELKVSEESWQQVSAVTDRWLPLLSPNFQRAAPSCSCCQDMRGWRGLCMPPMYQGLVLCAGGHRGAGWAETSWWELMHLSRGHTAAVCLCLCKWEQMRCMRKSCLVQQTAELWVISHENFARYVLSSVCPANRQPFLFYHWSTAAEK